MKKNYLGILILVVLAYAVHRYINSQDAVSNSTFTQAEERLGRRLDSLECLMELANAKLDSVNGRIGSVIDTIEARCMELRNGELYIVKKLDSMDNRTNTNTFKLW